MKFNCGKRTYAQRKKARQKALKHWHKWFAWYPVRLGEHDCRWLEFVQRRGSIKIGYVMETEYCSEIKIWYWRYKE